MLHRGRCVTDPQAPPRLNVDDRRWNRRRARATMGRPQFTMNTKLTSLRFATIALISTALAAGLSSGCSKKTQSDASAAVKGAYEDTKAAMGHAWDSVKSYTFDKKDDFTANAKALSAKMDAQVSEVRADVSDAKASASRKAAFEELKNAQADYKEKLSALGNATAATWESAKNNVIAAWDRLEAAYYKARAE